jgi:hypothetical protein
MDRKKWYDRGWAGKNGVLTGFNAQKAVTLKRGCDAEGMQLRGVAHNQKRGDLSRIPAELHFQTHTRTPKNGAQAGCADTRAQFRPTLRAIQLTVSSTTANVEK